MRKPLLGHPFVAGASLRDGRFAWCKHDPRPAEGAIGVSVEAAMPAACTS